MSADSFQLMGMAERGMLPSAFARRSRHGTPTLAILFSAMGILVLSLMSFLEIVRGIHRLVCVYIRAFSGPILRRLLPDPHNTTTNDEQVELLNTLYILATILEYAAFIKLRYAHPELHRPWRIPIGNRGMVALLSLPMAFLLYILYLAPLKTWLIIGAANLVGCGLYFALSHPSTRLCCRFREVPGDMDTAPVPSSGSSSDVDDEEEEEDGLRMEGGEAGAAAGGNKRGMLRYGSDSGYYVAV